MRRTTLTSLIIPITAIALLTACGGGERQVETKEPETKDAGTKQAETKAPPPDYFKVDPATAGRITGRVSFTGRKPARKTIDVKSEEASCATAKPLLTEDVVVNPGNTLANVFVYVSAGLEGKAFPPPPAPLMLDQHGCAFIPHVIGLRAGQPFIVTNSDKVRHNVHPTPMTNVEWNQGQRPGGRSERVFDKPEIGIHIKCNVHPWMNAFACVVDHPYFAVTGTDGSFELKNLPPGDYTVTAWHEKLGTQEQKVTVAAAASSKPVAFSFAAR